MAKANIKEDKLQKEEMAATISQAEVFYNEHKKTLWGIIICVLAVGLLILGYSKFIYAPAAQEAQEAAFPAEMNFQQGEFELALNGDGNVLGFAQIIDEYGAKAGKAVYLYAGACNAQLGNWEEALSYLKKYNGKDAILAARALALQGDCYSALEDYAKAVKLYEQAAAKADNMFAAAYLVKAGQVYLQLGENAKALQAFETVKDKYPQSIEGYEIDKYINLAK
ncbi:MAG: tetratricopeptide repeat protein [Bacteroidales bacterium]|nr:tetratricopeptide repeat protein [Bacteroidales bacterium]